MELLEKDWEVCPCWRKCVLTLAYIMVSLPSNRTIIQEDICTKDWGFAVTDLAMLFVEEYGRHWNFVPEKQLNALGEAEWDILVEAWKTVVLRAMRTVGTQLKRF